MSDGRDEAAAHLASCLSPPPHRVIPGRLPEWRRAVAYDVSATPERAPRPSRRPLRGLLRSCPVAWC